MEKIKVALLTGQKSVMVQGIDIILKPLTHDTQKNKEREAERRALAYIKLIS